MDNILGILITLLLFIRVHYQLPSVASLPQFLVDKGTRRTETVDTMNYDYAAVLLDQYGYLDGKEPTGNPIVRKEHPLGYSIHSTSDGTAAFIRKPEALQDAFMKLQKNFNLSVTGILDRPTHKLLTTPRCGNPDFPLLNNADLTSDDQSPISTLPTTNIYHSRHKRYVTIDERFKWNKRNLTWQIQSYPTNSLSRVRTHTVFQHAFNLWSSVTDMDFFEEKDYYKPADIIIKFGSGKHGDSMPFDGAGGVLAHAYHPNSYNVYSLSGDAHFDDDEVWTDIPHKSERNLVPVATHELGHSLGLGHSLAPTSVMYPLYIPAWTKTKLDDDDIAGIQKLYGKAKPGKILPEVPELPDIPPPPPVTTAAPEIEKAFDYCNISIDAIFKIRNIDLYVFKGEWQWRVTWSKTVTTWITYQFHDGPAKITYYWPALPKYVDYIDAGIERRDAAIYIFRGRRFWLLSDNARIKRGFPEEGLPLIDLGLPSYVDRVDCVFNWGDEETIYIFSGDYYWKLDENAGPFGQVTNDPNYPRLIADTWQGVPTPTQAAFTGLNGETLFFEGSNYYVFDNIAMHTRPGYPQPATLGILGCMQ